MSDSTRLSHRAVAASAAFLLTGMAFAGPALADDGKGKDGKGGKGGDRGSSASQGRSHGSNGSKGSKGDSGARSGGAKGGSGAKGDNGDPAGNNGTFKVDGLPYSDGMANEPHVECGFRLKFFGFDDDQTGDITIAGHAPSGSGVVSKLTGVTISDDAAGGGPNDPDAIFEYTADDLDLAGLTAHPKQGYHLKVTLNTDTPGGVKHKVFWFEPCEEAPVVAPTTSTPPTTGTGSDTDTDVGGVVVTTPVVNTGGTTEGGTAVLGTKFVRTGTVARNVAGNVSGSQVLGTRFDRAGALPRTGSVAGTLLALGGGLVVVGGGAWMIGRRMRHVA